MSYRSCPECGARLASGARRCDLCGATLEVQELEPGLPADAGDPAASGSAADASGTGDTAGTTRTDDPSEASGAGDLDAAVPGEDRPDASSQAPGDSEEVFCSACGAANAPGSNFCSRCGERLQRAHEKASGIPVHPPGMRRSPKTPRSSGTRRPPKSLRTPEEQQAAGSSASAQDRENQRGLTRQVVMLIGLAVLVVVALYMVSVISKQRAPVDAESIASAPAETRSASIIQEREAIPISEAFRDRADSLRSVIEGADAAESVQPRRQLVDFLIGIGRIDRAAIEQQRVARITDDAADWKKAGNLLFDWMETTEPDSKSSVALLTIDAYKRVLQQRPDDLDARADLGWAYQYDPQNPMEAIRHTNLVLEESPEHLTANYNRGVFLMRINRIDDALKQFQRVKAIAGDDSPYHRQADMWIDTIRESLERGEAG